MMMGDIKQLAFRDKIDYNGKSNKQVWDKPTICMTFTHEFIDLSYR